MKYVDVVVDNVTNSTDNFFTYRCSDDSVMTGSVVKVPFASMKRELTGYVFGVSEQPPENVKRLRDVSSVSGEYSLPPDLIRMSSWMKHRYMCRYIDAVYCMIPPGKKPKRAPAKDPLDEYRKVEDDAMSAAPPLTDEQQAAFDQIKPSIHSRSTSYFGVWSALYDDSCSSSITMSPGSANGAKTADLAPTIICASPFRALIHCKYL